MSSLCPLRHQKPILYLKIFPLLIMNGEVLVRNVRKVAQNYARFINDLDLLFPNRITLLHFFRHQKAATFTSKTVKVVYRHIRYQLTVYHYVFVCIFVAIHFNFTLVFGDQSNPDLWLLMRCRLYAFVQLCIIIPIYWKNVAKPKRKIGSINSIQVRCNQLQTVEFT